MGPNTDDVHVWEVDLDDESGDPLLYILSRDEQAKAERFARRELRLHYARCRSALRTLLSRYTQQPAAALRFEHNRFGKPALAGSAWHFNVSHSGARALIAIARQPLGIDLETLDNPGIDPDGLAPLVCHPRERALLNTLPAAERRRLFYQLWTRKEAYCKAIGLGLQQSLPALRMQPLAGSPAVRVVNEQTDDFPAHYVHELPAIAGYAASLCLPSAMANVRLFTYRGLDFPEPPAPPRPSQPPH